jgi:tetratricopeptide (TPR) repeat protein
MPAEIVGRQTELHSIGSFLDAADLGPGLLVLDGEPGIGKTTLWEAGISEAANRGYMVMACRGAQSEVRLSYSAVADLFAEIGEDTLRALPQPQREAMEVVLLRSRASRSTIGRRLVAAASLAVIERLSEQRPLVIAADDFNWLDLPSRQVIEYVGKRIKGRIGILISQRSGARESTNPVFTITGPNPMRRLDIGPLSLAAIHHLLRDRTGRVYPRPTLVRIHEASGGNPFFALELDRVLVRSRGFGLRTRLPTSLAELTRARVEGLASPVRGVLLAAAALANPTVDVLRKVVGSNAAELLAVAEDLGIVELIGPRVRFTHPILASGIYGTASAAVRRAIHRRLATANLDIEERARHLALAATFNDPETISALDAAAESARKRGAPAAAADLLELAIQLGADDAQRKIRAAADHYEAGDPLRAKELLEETIRMLSPSKLRAEALLLLASVRIFDDSYPEAANLLERALVDATGSGALGLQIEIQVELSYVEFNLGRMEAALSRCQGAVRHAETHGDPGLTACALALFSILRFMRGYGVDEPALERALALERPDQTPVIWLRPSMMASLIAMWSGRLNEAYVGLQNLHKECIEKGAENDLGFVEFHLETLACWLGDLATARRVANDSYERALQLGTEIPLGVALSAKAHAAAYIGQAEEARHDAQAAYDILQQGTLATVALAPLATIGFIDLSLDHYEAAALRLGPMASGAIAVGLREPSIVPFAPDAAEALIAVGRLDEATVIIDWLEDHGRRLERPWAQAAGSRCRGLLLAATAQLESAIRSCEEALIYHDQLEMPLEKGRTLLVLGRLQRRRGKRRAAKVSLERALAIFAKAGRQALGGKSQKRIESARHEPGRRRSADSIGEADRRACGEGPDQPAGRCRAAGQPQDGRSKPRAGLPETRRSFARRARTDYGRKASRSVNRVSRPGARRPGPARSTHT